MTEEPKNYYEAFKALTERKVVGFEMFSKAGNKACSSLVKKVCKKICGKAKVNAEQITDILKKGVEKISAKHEEVQDSEPPYHISFYVNKCLEEQGYSFEVDSYDIG